MSQQPKGGTNFPNHLDVPPQSSQQPDNELDDLLWELLQVNPTLEPIAKKRIDAKQRLLAWQDKAVKEAVTKVTLAGMPELTPRQQDYITKWLKGGSNE